MDGPDFIDANSGKRHRPSEGFRPPDACAPNTIWHLLPTGTGSKNANKSSGYFATKQERAQGKAAFLIHFDTRSAPEGKWQSHPNAALESTGGQAR
jgi:hypothetical protein